jgi:hypothetical protein
MDKRKQKLKKSNNNYTSSLSAFWCTACNHCMNNARCHSEAEAVSQWSAAQARSAASHMMV